MTETCYAIYLLWDPRNGDIRYIGKSSHLEKRFKKHRQGHALKQNHCRNWQLSLRREGVHCELSVVEDGLTEAEANEKEVWWIKYGRECNWPLTNLTEGGDGGKTGRQISEVTRARISAGHLGCKLSQEHRAKISAAGKGRKLSQETRRRMSIALLGNKRTLGKRPTQEIKEKIRQAAFRRRRIKIGV